MKKRFYFNLIEILLAIGIISVGLSSAMVLFTSGLRVNNDAGRSGVLPDAAEAVLAEVRRKAVEEATAAGWGTWPSATDFAAAGVQLSSFTTTGDAAGKTVIVNDNTLLYRQLKVTELYDSGSKKGQPKAWEPEFSVIAEVRNVTSAASSVALSNPRNSAEELPSHVTNLLKDVDDQGALTRCRKVLEVRLSYPAEQPMDSREVQYFRLELFNEKYDRFNP
ncbi:MAG: hypothetical protein IJT50_11435 [Lentisphaeria bacterium]|nr:hypothetical protein [Lentisphaeria bacterium]